MLCVEWLSHRYQMFLSANAVAQLVRQRCSSFDLPFRFASSVAICLLTPVWMVIAGLMMVVTTVQAGEEIAIGTDVNARSSVDNTSAADVTAKDMTRIDLNHTKSPNDHRQYRYIRLPNGLQALLISDPTTDKAAAALDVNVGHYHNPADRQGLAHFLEHMLFLGTEKYPQPNEYQDFISQHGGSHNAYTTLEHTNYYFDVNVAHLESALDRFAQFFISPLFDPDYVDRERHAVHSEYKAKINDEYRRTLDVHRQLYNPEHPASKFAVGSLDTLADRENETVREALLAFYDTYYSSDIMALVVLGQEPLSQLESMVKRRFQQVPRRDQVPELDPVPLFEEDKLPLRVTVKPERDLRSMTLSFPVAAATPHYHKKPLTFIADLLGHEGEGSLLSLLKQLGLAESLSAGVARSSQLESIFQVTVELTDVGLYNQEQVEALVFHVLESMAHKGLRKWRYQELQRIARISYRYQEAGDPLGLVRHYAAIIHEYSPDDILQGDYLFAEYDSSLIRQYLKQMSPDNVLITVRDPALADGQTSPWFNALYAVSEQPDTQPPIKRQYRKQMFFPDENIFIPDNLELKSRSMLLSSDEPTSSTPSLIKNSSRLQAWYAQDAQFSVPKSSVRVRLKSPLVASGVGMAARNHLFVEMVNDHLNEFAYPAYLAGLSIDVRANSRGIDVELGGYNDKQGLLLKTVVDAVRKPVFDEDRFNNLKTDLLRKWGDVTKEQPYRRVLSGMPTTLYAPYWDELELAAELESVTLQDMKNFAARLRVDASIEALFYGNLTRLEAIQLSTMIEHKLLGDKDGAQLAKGRVVKFTDMTQAYALSQHIDHDDAVVSLYVQGIDDSLTDRAHMLMLRQILHNRFYQEMRTERQLGYIVFVTSMDIKDVSGTAFLIQSPRASQQELIELTTAFVADAQQHLPDDLTQQQKAVIAQLTEKPKSLSAQATDYWTSVLKQDEGFDYNERLAQAVQTVDKDSLRNYFTQVLQPAQRRLWVVSKPLVDEANHPFKVIKNRQAFKRLMPFYQYR